METFRPYAALIGRVMLSLIFLFAGIGKITNWSETAASMEAKGMPAVPLFLAGAIVLEIGGGLSLLLGFYTRVGALALVFFLIPTTLIFHDFWAVQGAEAMNQMQHFMKNVTIMGGLFALAAAGAGAWAIDGLRWPSSSPSPGLGWSRRHPRPAGM